MRISRREQVIRQRFPIRVVLSKEQLAVDYFADLPREAVIECLSFFERECRVSIGFLRPEDTISTILAPVHTRNPFRWLFYRAGESDGGSELEYQLRKRLEAHEVSSLLEIKTLGDYVAAWSGT
jgi:hypothetical protein